MLESRHFQRFTVEVRADLSGIPTKGHLVSLSRGGCAIRTSQRLKIGDRYLIRIRATLERPVEVVWEVEDYRIDTLYRYGLKFVDALEERQVERLVKLIA